MDFSCRRAEMFLVVAGAEGKKPLAILAAPKLDQHFNFPRENSGDEEHHICNRIIHFNYSRQEEHLIRSLHIA